jgi:amino acid transporter
MVDPSRAADTEPGTGFHRELSTWGMVAIGVGTVLGSGFLFLPATVAAATGPSSIAAWLIAGVAMSVLALCFAELAGAYPGQAGAIARFPRFAFGPFVGHMAGWGAYLSYCMLPPVEANAVVRYLGAFVPGLVGPSTALTGRGLALAGVLLVALNGLQYLGIRHVGRFMKAITVLKLIPLVAFVIAMLAAFHPANFSGPAAPFGGSGFLLAIAATIFGFTSFLQPLDYAAESTNPAHAIPRALMISQVIVTSVLVLVAIAFLGGLNWPALTPHGVTGAGDWVHLANLPQPLVNAATAGGFAFVAVLMAADGILSPNGPAATNAGSAPRVAYALARNGTLPAMLSRLHPRRGIPVLGLGISFVIELVFLVALPAWDQLVPVVTTTLLVGYALGPVALTALRRSQPEQLRPFRLRAHHIVAPAGFVVASLLIYWSKWPATGFSLAVLLLGAVFYLPHRHRAPGAIRHGAWLIVYLIALAVLSALGDNAFGGHGTIPLPYDSVTVAAVALACYLWAIHITEPVRRS